MAISPSRGFALGLFACIYGVAKWSDSPEIRYIAMILSVILLLVTMSLKWWNKYKHKISSDPFSLPGPKPNNAATGNLSQLAKCGSLHAYIKALSRVYGPIGAFYWGTKRVAYVSSLAVVSDRNNKELLNNLDTKPSFLYEGLLPLIGEHSIYFANSTVYHAKFRNIFATLFTKQNIHRVICEQHKMIENDVTAPWIKKLNTEEAKHMNIEQDLFAFATKSVIHYVFGVALEDMNDNDAVSETIAQMMTHYNNCCDEMEQRLIYGVPPDDNRAQIFTQSMKHLQHNIAKLVDISSMSSSSISMVKYCKEHKEIYPNIDKQYVIDDVITTLSGIHKMYYALLWTLYFVAKHNNTVENKMMQEIAQVFEDEKEKEAVDDEQYIEKLMKLKYCRNVILESLRITSICSWTARVCNDGDIILDTLQSTGKKVKIPQQMPIIFALGAMNLEQKQWKDPYTFKPDRFVKYGDDAPTNNIFGGLGNRVCPAQKWFQSQALLFMVKVLSKFELQLTNKNDTDAIRPRYSLMTKPHKTIHFMISKRQFALL